MADCEAIEKLIKSMIFKEPNPTASTSGLDMNILSQNQPQMNFGPFLSAAKKPLNTYPQFTDDLSISKSHDFNFLEMCSGNNKLNELNIGIINSDNNEMPTNSKNENVMSFKDFAKLNSKQNVDRGNYSFNLPDENSSICLKESTGCEKLMNPVASEEKAKSKNSHRRERRKKKKEPKPQKSKLPESKMSIEDPFSKSKNNSPSTNKSPVKEQSLGTESIVKEKSRMPVQDRTKVYSITRNKNGKWSYYCEVCYRNLADTEVAKHMALISHKKNTETMVADRLLSCLPEPLPAQVLAVDDYVNGQARTQGLSAEEEQVRRAIQVRIHNLVSKHLTGCSINAVGSSTNGFGLKSSKLDLVLKVPPKDNAADMLSTCFQILLKDRETIDVQNDFKVKIPLIKFKDRKRQVVCNIIIDNGNATQLTKLFTFYSSLDYRVPILGKAFRAWAQGCEMNNPEKGTLQSFVFPILLIHFLQQENPPVLPVLQESEEWSEAENLESFKAKFQWKSKNKDSVGRLWLKLFNFYTFQYKPGIDVVSIRTLKKSNCNEKNWGTKFYAIEDPFVTRNLGHVIPNRSVFQYIYDCFLNTYRYFGFPQLKSRQKINIAIREPSSIISSFVNSTGNTSAKSDTMDEISESVEGIVTDSDDNIEDLMDGHDTDIPFQNVITTINKMSLENEPDCNKSSEVGEENEMSVEPIDSESKASSSITSSERSSRSSPYYWDIGNKDLHPDMLKYDARFNIFRGGKAVPLVCRLCQKSGHLKDDCPKESLPEIHLLPPMVPEFLDRITEVCLHIKNEKCPTDGELQERERDTKQLQAFIREDYPNAVLKLFGSFCNGFGFSDSDMDFCLTFWDSDGKDLDHKAIIESLAEKLKTIPRFMCVSPIIGAKVPIVKFFDSKSQLENDISLYNTLAQYNTKLLRTYCDIDNRVQILGYVFKYFAKTLGICDASKGSLSSYAYVLMAIYFLQQRKPPVLPVLQELYSGKMPFVDVDGWNAWFFCDIPKLQSVWPEYGKNRESVGSLWVGLLSFYAAEFNMKDHVVCIRQKKPLTRFYKLWNSKKIAIEDPFDLNHNLGSGLSRKMHNFIMKAFIRGREHFGTPVSLDMMNTVSPNGPKGYLFDRHRLNCGQEPPRDRGCRICGKIGHMQKDCTQVRPRRDRRMDRKRNEPVEMQNFPRHIPYKVPQKARGLPPVKANLPSTAPKASTSSKHGPPPSIKSPLQSFNKTPPGFQGLPNQYKIPPPGFKHGMIGQQQPLFSNGSPQMMVAHQQQQQYQARPATTNPFPMPNRAINNALLMPNNPCLQKLPIGNQPVPPQQIWQPTPRINNLYQQPQTPLQNQQSSFVPINMHQLYQQQVASDWGRTSTDLGQLHNPFQHQM